MKLSTHFSVCILLFNTVFASPLPALEQPGTPSTISQPSVLSPSFGVSFDNDIPIETLTGPAYRGAIIQGFPMDLKGMKSGEIMESKYESRRCPMLVVETPKQRPFKLSPATYTVLVLSEHLSDGAPIGPTRISERINEDVEYDATLRSDRYKIFTKKKFQLNVGQAYKFLSGSIVIPWPDVNQILQIRNANLGGTASPAPRNNALVAGTIVYSQPKYLAIDGKPKVAPVQKKFADKSCPMIVISSQKGPLLPRKYTVAVLSESANLPYQHLPLRQGLKSWKALGNDRLSLYTGRTYQLDEKRIEKSDIVLSAEDMALILGLLQSGRLRSKNSVIKNQPLHPSS